MPSVHHTSHAHILVVSDDDDADLLDVWLAAWGFSVTTAHTARAGQRFLRKSVFDLVILALAEDSEETIELIQLARKSDMLCPVVFIDMPENPVTPAQALRRGAFQYLKRPLNKDEVRVVIDQAIQQARSSAAQRELLKDNRDHYDFESMIGKSETMRHLFALVDRLCDSPSPVLIRGESGTGKELIARAIHFRGQRALGPFVPINCAAIPDTLLESELFGYERGAFTGATKPRPGLFVQASGGTLFLDEIGDLPLALQPKLLRVLQDREVRPLGSDSPRKVDVRIVAATHVNLNNKIQTGAFRADLFYRLNVVSVKVPPLRERLADIPFLVDAFLEKLREQTSTLSARRIAPEVMEALLSYQWPGNIRELENALERASTLCAGEEITAAELEFIETVQVEKKPPNNIFDELPTLKELQSQYINYILKKVNGHHIKASVILDVNPSTLYRRQKKKRS